jgi:HAD superfamily hydrolase (TIGR01490 family)
MRMAAVLRRGRRGRRNAPATAGPGDDVRALLPAAAFFDLDNTVLRGAAMYHLARGLRERRFFGRVQLARAAWWQAYFRLVGVEDPQHMAEARRRALAFIADRKAGDLERLAAVIVDEKMMDRLWPGTLAMVARHLDAGDEVWIVTAAPVEVASVIADRLGLPGALGTVPARAGDTYTGLLVGDLLHGQAKANAVVELAATRGFDLERCAAYSDSANDIPMLSLVGAPVAVNPDGRLREYAHAHGWPVRDYRTGRRAVRAAAAGAALSAAFSFFAAAATAVRRRLGQ